MRRMRHYGPKHGQGSSELGWPERQPQCEFRVKLRKHHYEQLFSAPPPRADAATLGPDLNAYLAGNYSWVTEKARAEIGRASPQPQANSGQVQRVKASVQRYLLI